MAVMLEMLLENMIPLFLIVLFGIRLLSKKSFKNTETKYFWLTLISCLLLIFEDALEAAASEDRALLYWRILLSVLGYTFRSTAALGLFLVVIPQKTDPSFGGSPALSCSSSTARRFSPILRSDSERITAFTAGLSDSSRSSFRSFIY